MKVHHYQVEKWNTGSISMTAVGVHKGRTYRLKRYLNPPWPAGGRMTDPRVREQCRRCEQLLQDRVEINRRLMAAGGRSGSLACAKEVFLCQNIDAPGVIEAVPEVQKLRQVEELRKKPKWMRQAMQSAAEALSRMHAARIVHGDIKPENILYRACGLSGHKVAAVLIDFDRSYLVDRVPGPEEIGGSVGFMAPEVVAYYNDEDCDDDGHDSRYRSLLTEKRDIFSLGAVFYWLLTDRNPITPAGEVSVSLTGLPRRMKPAKLQGLLLQMLALDPTGRPGAAEVARQLKRL